MIRLFIIFTSSLFHRTLHHCHVPQVPSRTLCLFFLPETAQQRHIQRAERQTLLSCLLRQTFRLMCPCQHHRPGSLYRLGSFHCYSPLLVGRTLDLKQDRSFEFDLTQDRSFEFGLIQDRSFESWENSPLNLENKEKLEKQLKRMVKKFYSKYNVVRHQIFFNLPYFLPFRISLSQSHSLQYIFHNNHYSLYSPYHTPPHCPHCLHYYCKQFECDHVYKKNSSPSYFSLSYSLFPSLYHLPIHFFSPLNFHYQPLSSLILSLYFVVSHHKSSVLFDFSRNEGTFLWRNYIFAPPCLQLQSLLELQYLYLICILFCCRIYIFASYFTPHRCSKNYQFPALLLITSLWLKCYLNKTNIYIEVCKSKS